MKGTRLLLGKNRRVQKKNRHTMNSHVTERLLQMKTVDSKFLDMVEVDSFVTGTVQTQVHPKKGHENRPIVRTHLWRRSTRGKSLLENFITLTLLSVMTMSKSERS